MKTSLSTSLTFFLKFLWYPFCFIFGLGMVITVFYSTRSLLMTLFTLTGVVIIMILAGILIFSLYQVSYDDNFLNVKLFLKETKIDLNNVRSISGPRLLELKPFFAIELNHEKETIKSIIFAPPITEQLEYTFTRKLSGRALTFKNKLAARLPTSVRHAGRSLIK